jgi:hypothetical protein
MIETAIEKQKVWRRKDVVDMSVAAKKKGMQ